MFLNSLHIKMIIINLFMKVEEPWDKVKCILWKKEKADIRNDEKYIVLFWKMNIKHLKQTKALC